MPRKIAGKEDVRTRLAGLSRWQTATRNDGAVAKTLPDTRALDQIDPLSEAVFFDELFHYIREIGAWDLLEAQDRRIGQGPRTRSSSSCCVRSCAAWGESRTCSPRRRCWRRTKP